MEKFLKNYSLIILLVYASQMLGKNFTKFKMLHKDNVNISTSRNLEKDNYIILYFNQDCNYSSGFVNEFRYDIDFIINKKNRNIKYKKESPFNVTKDYEIEIHFNKVISILNHYFDNVYDKNMKFLLFADLSNFESSKLTYMLSMFNGCSSLISIDLSNFDTSKVTNMVNIFNGCSSLISIDLSNFDTSKVTNMMSMFNGCSSLISIDLSNFNMSNCISYNDMFSNNNKSKSI